MYEKGDVGCVCRYRGAMYVWCVEGTNRVWGVWEGYVWDERGLCVGGRVSEGVVERVFSSLLRPDLGIPV